MRNKTDLRVIKTKANIKGCFWELLKRKPSQKITVKEICDLAKCSRNTFYMHYPYKEALYEEIIDEIIEKVLEGFYPIQNYMPGTWYELSEEYFKNCMTSIAKIKEVFFFMKPGKDTFNAFIANLSEKLSKNLFDKSLVFHSISQEKLEIIKIGCMWMAYSLVSFGVYWLTETSYSIEEAMDLVRPEFMAMVEAIEKQIYE